MAKTAAEISIEMQEKFELYLLGLIFAVLSLSIQTAKFSSHLGADTLELLGWASLFAAGVIGILRAEWIPVVHRISSRAELLEGYAATAETAIAIGDERPVVITEDGKPVPYPPAAALERYRKALATLERQRTDAEAKILTRYARMKWGFMVGIGCVALARALPHLQDLTRRIAALF